MIKRILIPVLLCAALINNATKVRAQVFKVESFDGTRGEIKVKPIDSHGILKILYLKNVINVSDVNYIKSAKRLNKHFIKVVYAVRAGVGMELLHTLILSIDTKKLYQSMHITSFFEENFIDFSKPVDTANMVDVHSIYNVSLAFFDSRHQGGKVKIKIHDERSSKHNTGDDFKRDTALVLNFDVNRHIFYDSLKSISQNFTVYNAKTNNESKKYISGTYPSMHFSQNVYYYIKGEWYERDIYGNLSGFTYR
ncbi:hypothetical protein [Mucilaginibacter gossypiicola]|uniref:hypothetical protein n=1 Tax=Mucilaginibacter gossypiicola TaxID=551995 RepID=UPI000B87803A|nr:hypothetical protein [Mucilaginibacter gossypiicola]